MTLSGELLTRRCSRANEERQLVRRLAIIHIRHNHNKMPQTRPIEEQSEQSNLK